MLVFSFLVLDGKRPIEANLVQNIKLVSWSLDLVPRLIKYLNIQNSVVVFTCFRLQTLFLANLVQKLNIVGLYGNLVPSII